MIGFLATESLASRAHFRPGHKFLIAKDESNLWGGKGQGTEVMRVQGPYQFSLMQEIVMQAFVRLRCADAKELELKTACDRILASRI